jgi:hypothetical protein
LKSIAIPPCRTAAPDADARKAPDACVPAFYACLPAIFGEVKWKIN